METTRKMYEKPIIEIIEMEVEGFLCASNAPAEGENLSSGGGWSAW
jgi:hypothetical protein